MQHPAGAGLDLRHRTVAVSSPLGHHQFVVPETELVPEIRKTGHRPVDVAVAFNTPTSCG
jgi:hypothetical protein